MVEWITTPGLTDYEEALAVMETRVAAIREGRRLGGEMFWGGLGGAPPR